MVRLKWLKWILINGWRNAASPVSHAKYVSLIQRFWDFSIFWGVPKIQQMIPFSTNNSSSTHTPHGRLWLQHHHNPILTPTLWLPTLMDYAKGTCATGSPRYQYLPRPGRPRVAPCFVGGLSQNNDHKQQKIIADPRAGLGM